MRSRLGKAGNVNDAASGKRLFGKPLLVFRLHDDRVGKTDAQLVQAAVQTSPEARSDKVRVVRAREHEATAMKPREEPGDTDGRAGATDDRYNSIRLPQ